MSLNELYSCITKNFGVILVLKVYFVFFLPIMNGSSHFWAIFMLGTNSKCCENLFYTHGVTLRSFLVTF